MADLLAPILTVAAIGLTVGAWAFYLHRIRQGRADPVVDPSWPSNLRPIPRHLHEPGDVDPPHSLYVDKEAPELDLGEPDAK